jgi:hypothetical protein
MAQLQDMGKAFINKAKADETLLKNKLVETNKKRAAKKKSAAGLRKKYVMPMTFMLFLSFYALTANIVFILWIMVKLIVKKNGLSKRKKSFLDDVDVFNILASSVFPQSTPSYVKMAGNLSRFRLRRKLKKELKKKKELARATFISRALRSLV